jgi:L-ascorbate metabolism protein UlaG (beta-lactamase superfamily)
MKNMIIILVICALTACALTKKNKMHDSPNFKDDVFVNTYPVQFHFIWEMFSTAITSDDDIERAVWPSWLETPSDKKPKNRVFNDVVRVTYINHAIFLIQVGGFNILTDPVFSEPTRSVSFISPKRIHNPGITMDNLPKIDVVIISHDHYDHLDQDFIDWLIKHDNLKVYNELGVSERISNSKNTVELDWWKGVNVDNNFKLWFLDVQHFSGRMLTDRNATLWAGFLLQVNEKKINFGGDSGFAAHYQQTYEKFAPIDIAFLPIDTYLPIEFFKPIHLTPYEAVQAHLDLKSTLSITLSIAMHFGTFQLNTETYVEPIQLLKQAKQKANIPSNTFITLNIDKPINVSTQQV